MIVEDDKQKLIDFQKLVKDGLDKVDKNNKEFWVI